MRLALRLLLLSVVLAACGDTTRKSACSVFDNGDGTRTIQCGDESVVVPATGDGTSCVKSPAADGGAVIACTDGTTVVLDAEGNVVHRGAGGVVGRVTLFGEVDHAGTSVRAVGTEHATVTDEKGDFYLAGLDAGVYDLLMERAGWEPLRLRNTIAVGGILYLEPQVLRRGRLLSAVDEGLWVSPAEDTVLVREKRELWLHRADRIDPVELSSNAPSVDDRPLPEEADVPAYAPDGGAVVFLETVDPASLWGRLRRYDVAAGALETVADRALLGLPLAGGAVLVWRAPAGVAVGPIAAGSPADVAIRYPDGGELALGTAPFRREVVQLEPQRRALAFTGFGETMVVDVAARTATPAGSGVEVAAWSPNGRKAALASPAPTPEGAGALLLFDLETRTIDVLAAAALYQPSYLQDPVSFSPDGTRVLFLGNGRVVTDDWGDVVFGGELEVVDTRTLEHAVAPDSAGAFRGWRFSPDGAAVLYQREQGSLVYWELARDRITPVGTASIGEVTWSSRGDRLGFVDSGATCRLLRAGGDGEPGIYLVPDCERISFLPDGERTAVIVFDQDTAKRDLRLWSGGDLGPILWALSGQAADLQIRFAPDGSAVLWLEADGAGTALSVYDLVHDTRALLPGSNGYSYAAFSGDGAFAVAISGSPGELSVLEISTGTVTALDVPVVSPTVYRDFVAYQVVDEGQERHGWWMAHFPRTPAE
jgi:hypothetical protein